MPPIGYPCYVVGAFVRDLLLGKENDDRCPSLCFPGARPDEMLEDIFLRLFDAAEIASMSATERKQHDKIMTTQIDILAGMHNSYMDGLEEGEAKEKKAIARNLRDLGVDPQVIRQATGLSEEEIRAL